MRRNYIFAFTGAICCMLAASAQGSFEDAIIENFLNQVNTFPQEKIYVHTDKPEYVSGDRLWFRAHVLNALSHQPLSISRYVYVELYDPLGGILSRVKVKNTEGVYGGYIDIQANLPEGHCTLSAYTLFMGNVPGGYNYTVDVPVTNPGLLDFEVVPRFSFEDRGVDVEFTFHGITEQPDIEKIILLHGGKVVRYNTSTRNTINFRMNLNKSDSRILEFVYGNYRKYIPVPYPEYEFEVGFFPEGGYLVAGKEGRVAFKAVSANGGSLDITGEITDSEGVVTAEFSTLHEGMGSFQFTPQPGQSYRAVCRTISGYSQSFPLPEVRTGVSVLVKNDTRTSVTLSAMASPAVGDLYLLGHSRAFPFFIARLQPEDAYAVSIPKDSLPSGVLHFLLLDQEMNVLSERLVFSGNGSEITPLEVASDKDNYSARDKVSLLLDIPSLVGEERGFLSLSVTDDNDVSPTRSVNILTSMLLTSDIKGNVDNPAFYFQDDPRSAEALDLLMMVNGWRRYDIPSVLKGRYTEPQEPLEIGQEISGTVTSLMRNKPLAGAPVSIISARRDFNDEVTTDDEGKFHFRGMEFPDSTTFIVQARNRKGEERASLTIDEAVYPSPFVPFRVPDYKPANTSHLSKSRYRFAHEDGLRLIYLDEIRVRGERKMATGPDGYMSHMADHSFTLSQLEDINPFNLEDLMYRIPGVIIQNGQIFSRTRNSIMVQHRPFAIVIDGIFMDDGHDVSVSTMGGHVLSNPSNFDIRDINIQDVARVDVFKTGSTTVFGYRGASGVISITTKRGNAYSVVKDRYNIKKHIPLGYQRPAEFYSPKYDSAESRQSGNRDMRTTIYWQPQVIISSGRQQRVEFWTADTRSTYTVVVEGVSSEGRIIHGTKRINVDNLSLPYFATRRYTAVSFSGTAAYTVTGVWNRRSRLRGGCSNSINISGNQGKILTLHLGIIL